MRNQSLQTVQRSDRPKLVLKTSPSLAFSRPSYANPTLWVKVDPEGLSSARIPGPPLISNHVKRQNAEPPFGQAFIIYREKEGQTFGLDMFGPRKAGDMNPRTSESWSPYVSVSNLTGRGRYLENQSCHAFRRGNDCARVVSESKNSVPVCSSAMQGILDVTATPT